MGSTYRACDNNLKYMHLNIWSECPFFLAECYRKKIWYPFSIAPICNSDIFGENILTFIVSLVIIAEFIGNNVENFHKWTFSWGKSKACWASGFNSKPFIIYLMDIGNIFQSMRFGNKVWSPVLFFSIISDVGVCYSKSGRKLYGS